MGKKGVIGVKKEGNWVKKGENGVKRGKWGKKGGNGVKRGEMGLEKGKWGKKGGAVGGHLDGTIGIHRLQVFLLGCLRLPFVHLRAKRPQIGRNSPQNGERSLKKPPNGPK